ncbi:abortive infection system toxin AbiGii family protein [Paenibacillus antarcticus]|uniref:Uncharacterized protein n=1 Tax=Paenibacillus antarcticus TaxID=253703 RepID=A0A168JWK4_9BACL|nr:abortive infection system toxin AbiGii family protein [Paenibacillus antarcticus]OAB41205.1 hypothetical protein PBAT_21875 [Paenibacillus antarcticus]
MMFLNFDKAFRKNNHKLPIPSEVIASLTESLPPNFIYVNAGEGACVVSTNSQKMDMSLNVELPEDFKPQSMLELMEFMYRAQRELRILPDKEGFITINGSKFLPNELIVFPLGGKVLESELYIKPQPFQPPFNVTLEGGGIPKEILMQRHPYADMGKSLFKSIGNSIIDISYIFDEVDNSLKFTFNISIEKFHSVCEIVESLKFYNACINGDIILAGMDFSSHFSPKEDKEILETIEFWEKINTLEKVLKVDFYLEFPITNEDALWVEKLFKSFVENMAYKQYAKVDNIVTVAPDGIDKDSIVKPEGIMFSMIQRSELNIWNTNIELFDVVGLFDLKVTDVILLNDEKMEYELIVEPIEGKKVYTSIRSFLNKVDADAFLGELKELQNAELLVEF